MSAVAESFKGYQYYEFTVIKDLAEPSRLLAEMHSSSFTDRKKGDATNEEKDSDKNTAQDDTLIDLDDLQSQEPRSASTTAQNGMPMLTRITMFRNQ